MNALTGSDFTCYPAASQVEQDFYNLLDVYIDAVFFPKLNELSFKQEGWRFDLDDTGKPMYKGIVYNEMKGALSSPTSRLWDAIGESLLPDLTYGISSGGKPEEIPHLTHQELLDFHRTYYHPSRCLFFFYGNLPLQTHLDFINERVLDQAEAKEDLPPIPKQKRFSEPVRKTIEYPIAPDESVDHKTFVAFSWLTCSILQQKELTALSIIEILLMDTDASPLKKAILSSGLCKDAQGAMDSEISEVPFILIMTGCKPGASIKLEKIIFDALQKIVREGIPNKLVEDALHQVEFHRSEISGDGWPFGLNLFMRSGLLRQHSGDPENGLVIHKLFKKLREDLKEEPRYLEKLIERYLLDNNHYSVVEAIPSQTLDANEILKEQESLKKFDLNPEQLKSQALELAKFQEEQEKQDIEVLPKISLSDVPKMTRDFTLTVEKADNLSIYNHETFTNGIVYANLSFPIPEVTEKELPYINLLANLLPQLSCGSRTVDETLSLIQGNLGGMSASLSSNIHADDPNVLRPRFHIRGKALQRKSATLFKLLKDYATSLNVNDPVRLRELILKHYTGLETGLNSNAMRYALNQSARGLTPATKLNYAWHGLDYFRLVRSLALNFEKHQKELIEQLESLSERLLGLNEADLVLTCTNEQFQELKREHFYELPKVASKSFTPWKISSEVTQLEKEGVVIGSPVAFTGKVMPSASYNDPDSPALSAASCLFEHLVLHPRIREQGGAYGSGAVNNSLSATFSFYAYRDPNISKTFDAFTEAVERVIDGEFNERDLEEAKLSIIQSLDSPVSPGTRGGAAYHWLKEGRSYEMRQNWRDRFLKLTKEEIQEAVKRKLKPHLLDPSAVVFAGKDLLEKENKLLETQGKKGFATITQV